MELLIRVNLDNAAFDGACGAEIARILSGLSKDLAHITTPKVDSFPIIDTNGNIIGEWEIVEEPNVDRR